MTEKIIVVDLETFRSGDQTAIQQKQVLLEALADTSKVIKNIQIQDNKLLITYADGGGDGGDCQKLLCGDVTVGATNRGLAISLKGDTPSKANGTGSFAMGKGCQADGDYSVAMGYQNYSKGFGSFAMGYQNYSEGFGSFAMGLGSKASGDYSAAIGDNNITNGNLSFALGVDCKTKGTASFSCGASCNANGISSIAMGENCVAAKDHAIAMGKNCFASGTTSGNGIAIGAYCKATANHAVAIGSNNFAYGADSTCMGELNKTGNEGEFACGYRNVPGNEKGSIDNQMFSIGMGRNLYKGGRNLFSVGFGFHDGHIDSKADYYKNQTVFGCLYKGEHWHMYPEFSTGDKEGYVRWRYHKMHQPVDPKGKK